MQKPKYKMKNLDFEICTLQSAFCIVLKAT